MASPKPLCTLHHLDHSQSQRILWLLEELALAYPSTFSYDVKHYFRGAGFRSPAALAEVHPSGKSPVLEVAASGRVIAESTAIAAYLLRTYDVEGKFRQRAVDGGAEDWLREEELVSFTATSLGALGLLMFITGTIVPRAAPWLVWPLLSPAGKLISYGLRPELQKTLGRLEKELLASQRNGASGYFSGGPEPSRVDFIASFPVDVVVEGGFADMKPFPALAAWRERYRARPAWKTSLDKGNGYDWKFYEK